MRRLFGFLLATAAAMALPAMAWGQDDEHGLTERLNRSQLYYRVMPRPNPAHRRWYWDGYAGRWVLARPGYTDTFYGRPPGPSDYWDEPPDEPARPAHAKAAPRAHTAGHTSEKMASTSHGSEHAAATSHGSEKMASISHTGEKAATSPTQTASSDTLAKVDSGKPLTPAEIRAAVPVAQLKDAKALLAKAQVKSVWGDVSGPVQNVDMQGAGVRAVEADVGNAFGEKQRVVKFDAAHLKFIRSRNVVLTSMSKPEIAKLPKANNS